MFLFRPVVADTHTLHIHMYIMCPEMLITNPTVQFSQLFRNATTNPTVQFGSVSCSNQFSSVRFRSVRFSSVHWLHRRALSTVKYKLEERTRLLRPSTAELHRRAPCIVKCKLGQRTRLLRPVTAEPHRRVRERTRLLRPSTAEPHRRVPSTAKYKARDT